MKIYKQIMIRAKKENRKKSKEVYYESHHIIPDFMFKNRKRKGPRGHLDGNPDESNNLVLLTMREHILAHVLLAKALVGKKYAFQAASALAFMLPSDIGQHARQNSHMWSNISKKYSRYKELGISAISKARKGTFPAIDAITGDNVGSVDVNHPKVLSGEWVHHSKGKHKYFNPVTGDSVWCSINDPRVLSKELISVGSDVSGMNNQNALADFTQEKANLIVIEVYEENKNNTFIISKNGHLHASRFLDKVQDKLRKIYPKRKAFTVVVKDRLGCSFVEFLNRELGLSLIQCTQYIKFPNPKRTNQC